MTDKRALSLQPEQQCGLSVAAGVVINTSRQPYSPDRLTNFRHSRVSSPHAGDAGHDAAHMPDRHCRLQAISLI
jgi:hypothetical protein